MAVTHHELAASPATCHWGSFDARLTPVLTVEPGDRVTVHTVNGPPDALPDEGFTVLPEQVLIHEQLRPAPGPHILTGPIRVAGAQRGDVLEIRILTSRCARTGAGRACAPCGARCRRTSTRPG
jgi:acetamidase/formamidase